MTGTIHSCILSSKNSRDMTSFQKKLLRTVFHHGGYRTQHGNDSIEHI